MINDDEYLERIVAGIHAISTRDADVRWNDIISGRQFDVSVRFKYGTHRYLLLVEVKNRKRKASIGDVEGFLQKAKDQHANKTVFVTSAGFQEGAISVARRHAIDLFTVTFDANSAPQLPTTPMLLFRAKRQTKFEPVEISISEPHLVPNVCEISLVYLNGDECRIPHEQSQMTYYCGKTIIGDQSLQDIIFASVPTLPLGEEREGEITFDAPREVRAPDAYFFKAAPIRKIKYRVAGREARAISGNTRIDPGLFTLPVVYTNVLTGEASRYPLDELPVGDRRISVGRFYCNVYPLRYFYCECIRGTFATWHMIESFQNGELVQATFTADICKSTKFIRVADKADINRLQARLNDYLKMIRRDEAAEA